MHRCTTALYFSPTGGTRTYVRAVAAAMPHMGGEVDLTRPEERRKVHMFGADDVVVLGVPVYYGRVPEVRGCWTAYRGRRLRRCCWLCMATGSLTTRWRS